MPVYNAAPYLAAAVESILAQTYSKIELLAIDDGSTDASAAVLQRLADRDRRVRLIMRENRGLVATLNEGLLCAEGTLIARMDADDVAYPGRIDTQVVCFEADPELALCGMHVDCLYGNRIKNVRVQEVGSRDIMIANIFHGFFIHPTVMLRSSILSHAGLVYDARYRHCEDFDLWRRMTRSWRTRFLTKRGIAWRQSSTSIRVRHYAESKRIHHRIIDEQLSLYGIIPNCTVFGTAIDTTAPVSVPELGALEDALEAIWRFPGFVGADRLAYERGFAFLIEHLIQALLIGNHAGHIVAWLRQSRFYRFAPRRDRLTGILARLIGDQTARAAVETARRANICARSKRITSKVVFSAAVQRAL
jgi:hypothetical protein